MAVRPKEKYSETEPSILVKEISKQNFDELYAQYGCVVYGVALKAVHSRERAEEVCCLTFSNIYKSINFFDNQKCSFLIWVMSILKYSIKRYLSEKELSYQIMEEDFPNFRIEFKEENNSILKTTEGLS